ncbi:MAG: DUF1326 domain-containing protein [Thermoleophilaceae bacterium]
MAVAASRWKAKVEMLMACNCEWGCPCSFQAPPTYGDCASALGYRIVEGSFDRTALDGLRWVLAAYWPGPLHELNGQGVVYLDSAATEDQLPLLRRLATGEAGGPIGIFMSTLSAGIECRVAQLDFVSDDADSRFAAGEDVAVRFESIRSPVSGSEHRVSLELPTGMLTNREHFFSTQTFRVDAGDRLRFSYAGRNSIGSIGDWEGP